jgi:hypothetical protein
MRRALTSIVLCLSVGTANGSIIVCNPTPITIPDSGIASPYPSAIEFTTDPFEVQNIFVTFNSFSHTDPDDVGFVLVGPTGAAYLLQDGTSSSPWTNATYSLNDYSGLRLPLSGVVTSGVFRPIIKYGGDSFDAPGPGTTYSNEDSLLAQVFAGQGNGNWSLYVKDFAGGNSGSIAGGWCLALNDVVFSDAFGF